jgi:hypothetical protein
MDRALSALCVLCGCLHLALSGCARLGCDADAKRGEAAANPVADERAKPAVGRAHREWRTCADVDAAAGSAPVDEGPTVCGAAPVKSIQGPGEPYLHLGLQRGSFDPLCARQEYQLMTVSLIDTDGSRRCAATGHCCTRRGRPHTV